MFCLKPIHKGDRKWNDETTSRQQVNSSLLDIWNHEIQVAFTVLFYSLQLQDVMESELHWDLGVLNFVHGSGPKELETKLGSQILSECKWDDHNEMTPLV